ncbi:MAG TPA: MMPL family transporter, partial [Nocardioides sp.]|nr:MMPL family transporter [Nocardioides sp.]
MRRWGEVVLRHRWVIVIGWMIIAVAGGGVAGTVSDRMTVNFSLPGQPGDTAANEIIAAFHNGGNTSPLIATVTLPAGQTITGHEAQVAKAFATLATADPKQPLRVVDESTTGDKAFRTSDDRTAYAMVFYPFPQTFADPVPTKPVEQAVRAAAPSGSTVGVTGMDALAVGDDSGGNGVLTETLLGAVGALVVLLFVFASLLAFMPLLVAAVSILTTFLLLLPLTYLTDVSFIVQFLVALVGLGVAIDYSLLFVTRWREERDHGKENHEAVLAAMETAGHAVLFSGITVAIGLLALVVLPVPFMRSVGMGGALIPLASVLVTLTLTPAILGSIGPRVDWPKIRHENKPSRGWTAWARLIVRRRWIAALSALAAIAVLFVAFLGIKIGAADSSSLAHSGSAYDTFQTLEKGGVTTGVLTPMEVLTQTDKAQSGADTLAKVDGVTRAVVPTGPGSSVSGKTVVLVF